MWCVDLASLRRSFQHLYSDFSPGVTRSPFIVYKYRYFFFSVLKPAHKPFPSIDGVIRRADNGICEACIPARKGRKREANLAVQLATKSFRHKLKVSFGRDNVCNLFLFLLVRQLTHSRGIGAFFFSLFSFGEYSQKKHTQCKHNNFPA